MVSAPSENDPTQETVNQLQSSNANTANVHSSLNYLYKENSPPSIGGGGSVRSGTSDRNGTMILTSGGGDVNPL